MNRTLALLIGIVLAAGVPAAGSTTAITNARVFDGTRVLPKATVIVTDGKIAAVGEEVAPPQGAEVIDGTGATLLPGFIDSHTHTWSPLQLERALVWKGGHAVSRPRQEAAAAAKPAGAKVDLPASGLVSDFEDGTVKAAFGAGWFDSTDRFAGGKSDGSNVTGLFWGAGGTERGTFRLVIDEVQLKPLTSPAGPGGGTR